jgi:putative membrane-bound dehydrogenase-like protein
MRSVLAGLLLTSVASAAPPPPPAEFAQPQSPAKPAAFPVTYVDQGKYDSRLAGLMAPDGFKTEVVADAPTVVNPVGLTFAPDGTLFVLEWTVDPVTQGRWFEFKETFRYRDGTTKQVATMKKFVMDVVKVLKYNPAKKAYDQFDTIIADELPSTLVWHDGWLYTASRGTVRRYKQSRKGGPWDVREVIAQGFCGFHHHQVSGLSFGNDGKLYITSGDDDNFAEGADGTRATVMRTGAVFRCNPDGTQLEEYSRGYRNPYRDLAHDSKFNWFHADNDNEDGSKFTGCRLVHVAEGVDYGWRLKDGARCCRPDFGRGAVAGELPGKLPPMLKTGRGSPAGVLIYNDTRLPAPYRGLMYYPDVFRKLVRAYTLREKGASFEVTHEFEFLKSADPLFRPCQMVTGPDGAIYVVDWRTDSGGAGRLSGDGQHGRIYRMTWVGTKDHPAIAPRGMDSWAKLVALPDAKLVEALDSPDLTDRVEARKEAVRRGPAAARLVLRRFVSGGFSPDGRLVAMGVLQAGWSAEVADLFRLLLNDASPDVRRLAADGLGLHPTPADSRTHEALVRLLGDDSPAVRRAAALAVGRVGVTGAAEALANAWKADDRRDPFLSDAYLRGLEKLGRPGVEAILALANSGQKADLDAAVAAFAGFRERAAAAALPDLLAHPHLSPDQRAELVRSFANYQFDPPLSPAALLTYLTNSQDKSPAVAIAGLEVLAGTGNATDPVAAKFVLDQLASTNPEVRAAAVRTVEEVRLTAATEPLIGMLNTSERPTDERLAALKALRAIGGEAAVKTALDLLARPEPPALKVEALRALTAASPTEARPVATKLLDQPDPTLIAEAVSVLVTTKDGAKLVGERYLANKLPRDLFPRVSDGLSKFNTDPVMARMHSEVLKGGLVLSLDPARVGELQKLVVSKGDPQRGKQLYLNTGLLACATCHRMEGVGGNIGPDLTRIWDTQTTAKLLEAIIDPSKEIKEGYQSYRATTVSGRVHTGLRVSESSTEVVLREATGQDVRLMKADLDEFAVSKTSLMPADAVSRLTFDQFLDLLAFLKSKSAQESLRESAGTAVLGYQVAVGPKSDRFAPVGKGLPPAVEWQTQTADATGRLDLAPGLPKGGASAYARTFVYSPSTQAVRFEVTTDDPMRVWVGRRPVADRDTPGTTAVTVELPAGWTEVLVKLAPGGGADHKLGVQVHGTGLRASATPEGPVVMPN